MESVAQTGLKWGGTSLPRAKATWLLSVAPPAPRPGRVLDLPSVVLAIVRLGESQTRPYT